MAAFTVTEPGDTIGGVTAGAASAPSTFTLSGRSNALVGAIGDEDWLYSSDGTNFFGPILAGAFCLLPVLDGQNQTRTYHFQRAGAVDSALTFNVAG